MSILVAIYSLFALLGFDSPIFKENVKSKVAQIEVCADSGCHE